MTVIAKGRGLAASTTRVQIVMDRFGDTRHEFDAADAQAVALAEERFRELTGSGFRAAAPVSYTHLTLPTILRV